LIEFIIVIIIKGKVTLLQPSDQSDSADFWFIGPQSDTNRSCGQCTQGQCIT